MPLTEIFFGSPSTRPSLLQGAQVIDPVAEHAFLAKEHLALPQRLAHRVEPDAFEMKRCPGEAAHDLGGAELAAAPAGKQDAAVE